MNKEAQDIISNEILQLTVKIEMEKPALYALLSETPLSAPTQILDLNKSDFSEYLESLKKQFVEFGQTAKNSICF